MTFLYLNNLFMIFKTKTNFQSSTIGGKHLLLLNQFMNLFGMPPLLGGGKDGLKIGSVGLLLIVTEVQVEI